MGCGLGRALVRRAFTELGVSQVVATTMAVNARSRRVLEKAGLRHARTLHLTGPTRCPETSTETSNTSSTETIGCRNIADTKGDMRMAPAGQRAPASGAPNRRYVLVCNLSQQAIAHPELQADAGLRRPRRST
jgi:hypothetical protein